MAEKTIGAEELERLDSQYVWHHTTQMKEYAKNPLILTGGKGAILRDQRGREFIDGESSMNNVNLGYGNERIIRAIEEQLRHLQFGTMVGGSNVPAIMLAKRLGDLMPGDLKKTYYVVSGSEATETSVKMARQYHAQTGHPRKFKTISRYRSYHGSTAGSMALTGPSGFTQNFEPLVPGTLHAFPPYPYRCVFDSKETECSLQCARYLEELVKMEGPETVSAIIETPVIAPPMLVAPFEYIKIVREICDKYNIVLVFDEVITGFGRTGKMFGFEHYSEIPDLLCLAKGITSGYVPMGAVVAKSRITEAFLGGKDDAREFMDVHTGGGHPVACAAALAAVDEYVERRIPERVAKLGKKMHSALADFQKESRIVGEVRGIGFLALLEIVRDKKTKKQFDPKLAVGERIQKRIFEKGAKVRVNDLGVLLIPPLITPEDTLDRLVEITIESVKQVTKLVL